MAIDLNELLLAGRAETLEGMGKMFALSTDLQRAVATNKWDEPGLVEAAAAKELAKAGENPRYQPQSSPAAA